MTTTPPINPSNPASTYPPHQQLIADAYTPDHRTISLAAQHLALIDVQAMCAVQDLWAQNQARGNELDRLAAELGRVRAELAIAKAERGQLHSTLLHFAAEAHRRKWSHDTGDEGPTPAAFAELHRIGNEMVAAEHAFRRPAAAPSA